MRYGLFAVLLFLTATGCKEEPSWKGRVFTQRNLSTGVGEVRIPSELWERVVETHSALITKSSSEKSASETEMKPLSVYLIEETRGVLGGRNLKLDFGPGGGELDLRDFISGTRGTFRLVFGFEPDAGPEVEKQVWYLSNAQKRKVGSDRVGAGCDTYMDISTFTRTQAEKDGMLLAIGSDRHVSALAGTYIFSAKRGGRVQVARLTILDSSKRKLMCHFANSSRVDP